MGTQKPKPTRAHPILRTMESVTKMPSSVLFELWVFLVLGFATAYYFLALSAPEHAPQAFRDLSHSALAFNSLYFSTITATTTGYGDIVPFGFSKVLAMVQSVSAFFIFGVFISKLVSQRQDAALEEIHKLTYEDVFHNTREGLYFVRKDFDHVISKVEEKQALHLEDWENLITAFKQAQNLVLDIPTFYDATGNHLYIIDARREELLQEAVHRTLHRVHQLLDTLTIADIHWMNQDALIAELRGLVAVVDNVMPLWRECSPYGKADAVFEDIIEVKAGIARKLGQLTA